MASSRFYIYSFSIHASVFVERFCSKAAEQEVKLLSVTTAGEVSGERSGGGVT